MSNQDCCRDPDNHTNVHVVFFPGASVIFLKDRIKNPCAASWSFCRQGSEEPSKNVNQFILRHDRAASHLKRGSREGPG
jgi:hypothetical protein